MTPGLNDRRLVRLMQAAVDRTGLDLEGLNVVTEAASGAYVVTPVLAALAGARQVTAYTRSTRYGSAEEIEEQTYRLAAAAGVTQRIRVVTELEPGSIEEADIITNSGHLRPIGAKLIGRMTPGAVIPLMYESWECRQEDVDLDACRRRGIQVCGTNERHPAIDVFSFLGMMAVKLLHDAGVAVYGCRVLLLCDNDFRSFIEFALRSSGACVDVIQGSIQVLAEGAYDAILVARNPNTGPGLTDREIERIGWHSPGAVVAQYWGDFDRRAAEDAGLFVWPFHPPQPGHMGVLPSDIGPEAIVRLQSGGLKAGEVLFRRSYETDPVEAEFVQLIET